jgi:uncharacterized OsmC-like protein
MSAEGDRSIRRLPSPALPARNRLDRLGEGLWKVGFLASPQRFGAVARDSPGPTERNPIMTISTEKQPLNGVDTPTLFATLDAVRGQHDIAKFQFRATNEWVSGTHSRSQYSDFYGAGQEMQHRNVTVVESDHPAVLVGVDNAPTPVEYLLHAIASCLTAGLANVAAARGVELHSVRSTVEGDIDLLGIFGMSDTARNGYEAIRVSFEIEGDADDETLRGLVEQSRRRSAVYDALTNPTPVVIDVVVR